MLNFLTIAENSTNNACCYRSIEGFRTALGGNTYPILDQCAERGGDAPSFIADNYDATFLIGWKPENTPAAHIRTHEAGIGETGNQFGGG